jgi:hypothetical protein
MEEWLREEAMAAAPADSSCVRGGDTDSREKAI